MLYNYLKVGIRNILKYKVFSFINVFGLAVAMSVCLLIILMLADQKRYDQFHANKDRIYRILSDRAGSKGPAATTPFPLANALKTNYPFIKETTQLIRGVGGDITYGEKTLEMRGYFADAPFFKVFSFPLEKGNKATALLLPNSIVISKELARQLFNQENPLGKTVQFTDRGLSHLGGRSGGPSSDWGVFTITGVMGEKDYKSHLQFDGLVSYASRLALYQKNQVEDLTENWGNNHCYTYVLLNQEKGEADLTAALSDIIAHRQAQLKEIKGFALARQKLTQITPGKLVSNESSYNLPLEAYYFLGLLALVIMLSASLNYTNLSIARALTRAKEIGVRKVTGAGRKDLIFQFLSESILMSLFAVAMAVLLLIFLKPAFRGLWVNQYLNFELQGNLFVYLAFTGLALLIGLMAGLYPALHLSAFKPVKVLKNLDSLRPGKLGMRKVLSVSQFVISLLFITTAVLLYNQFKHFVSFDYRFTAQNIVNISLQGNDYRKVSQVFSTVPGVATISACDYLPATYVSNEITVKPVGSRKEYTKMTILLTDENFVDNLGVKLLAGRRLEPASAPDSASRLILVNEASVKALGYQHPSQLIGQTIESEWGPEMLEVIGVVEDFVFRAPMAGTDKIGPLVLRNEPRSFTVVNVQLTPGNLRGTVAKLAAEWKQIDPVHPFQYEFYDQQLAETNQGFFDLVSILGFLALLAVIISCLGLLGMATYTVERRRKEVGIRKVLGAADWSIAFLLSKEFVRILIVAIGIGAPLSYFLNNLWLQHFPNRVPFGLGTILSGTLLLLGLGLLTIGSQTLRTARTKPVDSLKVE